MPRVEVEITNFQPMAHETVVIDGFSAVEGRSNLGKSAIVRAIKAALTGAPADGYVRHRTDCTKVLKDAKSCKCTCSVRIKSEGLDLFWEKGDTVNRYVYNGTEYTVPGRGAPEFLGPQFDLTNVGGDKVLLQVADQFEPLFLVNKSGTVVADVLSDVAQLDEINVASRLVEKDRKEAAGTRKVREKDLRVTKEALTQYEPLTEVGPRAAEVEQQYLRLEATEHTVEELDRLADDLYGVLTAIKRLTPVESIVCPEIITIESRAKTLDRLDGFATKLRPTLVAVNQLNAIDSIKVPELASLELAIKQHATSERLGGLMLTQDVAAEQHLKELEAVSIPALDSLASRVAVLSQLSTWIDALARIKGAFEYGKALPEVLGFPGFETVQQKLTRISKMGLALSECTSELEKLTAECEKQDSAVASLQAEFDALGVCPACKQPLSNHIHGAA